MPLSPKATAMPEPGPRSPASPLSIEELHAWFRLLEVPGLGRSAARRLLAAFGSPQAALKAPHAALSQAIPAALAQCVAAPPATWLAQWVQRWAHVQAWLAAGNSNAGDRWALHFAQPQFPPRLLHTADPPLLIFGQGPLHALTSDSVAVVGSRHPSAQGQDCARQMARELASQGLSIVSGLALGIDAAAHEGALQAGGTTIAVLGCGPDQAYPVRHGPLMQRILQSGGVVLSEYAPGTPPLAAHFPQRNRIIAGLALGTLVVEAAPRSGSLITARLASEAGREVFAVPGPVQSPQSRGCHQLIRQGAALVETAQDILDELAGPRGHAVRQATHRAAQEHQALSASAAREPQITPNRAPHPAGDADPVLNALGHSPCTLDTLVARTGWPVDELNAKLLELEFAQRLARLPGGLYQRRANV